MMMSTLGYIFQLCHQSKLLSWVVCTWFSTSNTGSTVLVFGTEMFFISFFILNKDAHSRMNLAFRIWRGVDTLNHLQMSVSCIYLSKTHFSYFGVGLRSPPPPGRFMPGLFHQRYLKVSSECQEILVNKFAPPPFVFNFFKPHFGIARNSQVTVKYFLVPPHINRRWLPLQFIRYPRPPSSVMLSQGFIHCRILNRHVFVQ